MVSAFNTNIKHIMANFITHETIICDDRDPTWINNRIKLIYERNSQLALIYLRVDCYDL